MKALIRLIFALLLLAGTALAGETVSVEMKKIPCSQCSTQDPAQRETCGACCASGFQLELPNGSKIPAVSDRQVKIFKLKQRIAVAERTVKDMEEMAIQRRKALEVQQAELKALEKEEAESKKAPEPK